MVAYKRFTLRILAVLVFILLTGLTTVALSQGETTENIEMNQSSTFEENNSVSQMHTIVLINNVFSPEMTEINQYDTVVWRNLNRPKRTFVLVGEDDLWEDFSLGYGRSFKYTFNETGTFDFSIKGEKGLQGSVVVRESRETTGGVPLSERETRQIQQEGTTETGEMNQSSLSEENKSVSQIHTIVLIKNAFSPEISEINQYDTVVWRNLNRPKRTFVLASKDKLWKDFSLGYGRSFKYTFNETGTFDFSIKGESGMGGTVLVIVPRETGGLPLSERETRQVQPGEEGVTPTLIEEVTPAQRAEEIPSSTVLIRGSVFYPETLEINKGEAVVWNNLNRPKRTFTLVSEEGLFENQAVGYGKSFSYTFNDAGGYTFKLEEIPGSEFILTVK